jgi:hypothetical protein
MLDGATTRAGTPFHHGTVLARVPHWQPFENNNKQMVSTVREESAGNHLCKVAEGSAFPQWTLAVLSLFSRTVTRFSIRPRNMVHLNGFDLASAGCPISMHRQTNRKNRKNFYLHRNRPDFASRPGTCRENRSIRPHRRFGDLM